MLNTSQQTGPAIFRITLLAIIPLFSAVLLLAYAAVFPRTDEGFSAAPELQPAVVVPMASAIGDEYQEQSQIVNVSFQQTAPNAKSELKQDASAARELLQVAAVADEESGVPKSAEKPGTAISLSQIDDLIRSGRYPFASKILDEVSIRASGLLRIQLQLRQGLCAELVGDQLAALSHYRLLSNSHQSNSIGDAANIAVARVLIDLGRHEVGVSRLMKFLLARERSMPKDLRGDVFHTLASALTPDFSAGSMLDESRWLVSEYEPTPEHLLERWDALDSEQATLSHKAVFDVRQLTDSPEGVQVSIQSASQSLQQVLDTITARLKWNLATTESLQKSLRERSAILDCEDLPLDVVLDCLLRPNSLNWSFHDDRLKIFRSDVAAEDKAVAPASQKQRLLTAERFQQLAIGLAGDHPATPGTYLLLGGTVAQLGDRERAIRFFETSANLFPRSPMFGATLFNLGKASLLHGQRDKALEQFYRTVDRVSGLEADSLAYLYVGRILIENDRAVDAIAPLTRGLSLAEETEYEAAAAVLLSTAYLIGGNAAAANAILMNHRAAFERKEQHSEAAATHSRHLNHQAALVSSLARFWGSQGSQRIREGREVLTALTNVKAEHFFGEHGSYLVGLAFSAIGLDEQRDSVFQNCLNGDNHFPLQRRMRSLLESDFSSEQSFPVPPAENSELGLDLPQRAGQPASETVDLSHQRSLRSAAETAYRNGDFEQVLTKSQECLSTTPVNSVESQSNQKAVLRLMAIVYQAQGRHDLAVRCLTGLSPKIDQDTDDSVEKGNDP